MNVAPGAWRYALPFLLAAPFALVASVSAGVLLAALGVAVLAFFRDPDRSPPPIGVVSPADGSVSVLREESVDGETRVRLGVFMNVWHVHVVRAPFGGIVDEVAHTPGAHRPAFSKDSDRNERVHVRTSTEFDVREGATEAEVTLVAGAFARRIHPYVEPGDELDRAERIGHIAFGSRVDVLFPPAVSIDDVAVASGDRVTAGETVILEPVETTPFDDPPA